MKTSILCSLLPLVSAIDFYTISTKSEVKNMNGMYLGLKENKIGAFVGSRESLGVAGKFFTAPSGAPSGTLALLSGSDWKHQVGLKLDGKGLMKLVDVGEGPTAAIIPKDAPGSIEWGVFVIDKGGEFTVKDGADIPTRRWIAYLDTDGAYYVGLWDGFTKLPRSFGNVTLVATKLADGAGAGAPPAATPDTAKNGTTADPKPVTTPPKSGTTPPKSGAGSGSQTPVKPVGGGNGNSGLTLPPASTQPKGTKGNTPPGTGIPGGNEDEDKE